MPERKSQPWLCLLGTEQRFPSPRSCTAAVLGSLCNVVSRSFCISCSKMSSTRSSVKSVKCPHGKARINRHLQLLYLFQINTNYLPSKPSPGKQTMVWHRGRPCLLWHHTVVGLVRQELPACLNNSEWLWIHIHFSTITVVMQMSLRLPEVFTDIRNPWMQWSDTTPVSYLQNSLCSGIFLLRSQLLYIFLYRYVWLHQFLLVDLWQQEISLELSE